MAKWVFDVDHSVVGFAIMHFTIGHVRGLFSRINGTINYEPGDIAHASVEAEIDASTLTTGVGRRDEHLRGPDFFDVAEFPKIKFKSSKFEPLGENRCRVSGELTVKGITRPVSFEGEFVGPVKLPEELGGETSLGFIAAGVINRDEFGITWGMTPIGERGYLTSREVKITLDIESDLSS